MRVWERGSGETWACGTGVTASSIVSYLSGAKSYDKFEADGVEHVKFAIRARGDKLSVDFVANPDGSFEEIYLTGPATKVFETDMDI